MRGRMPGSIDIRWARHSTMHNGYVAEAVPGLSFREILSCLPWGHVEIHLRIRRTLTINHLPSFHSEIGAATDWLSTQGRKIRRPFVMPCASDEVSEWVMHRQCWFLVRAVRWKVPRWLPTATRAKWPNPLNQNTTVVSSVVQCRDSFRVG